MHGIINIKVHPVYPCARLSVRIEQLDTRWTDFYEILYLNIFRKYAEKKKVLLKSD
jgi:hypothetical protein